MTVLVKDRYTGRPLRRKLRWARPVEVPEAAEDYVVVEAVVDSCGNRRGVRHAGYGRVVARGRTRHLVAEYVPPTRVERQGRITW